MFKTLAQARRYCSSTALFSAALAVGAALYARQILATWAEKTESDLLVLCLPSSHSPADPADLIEQLQRNPVVRNAEPVSPEQVRSWVSQALRETGTTATLQFLSAPISAIELKCRGAVRQPQGFAAALRAIKNNPAIGQVFFNTNVQKRAATFYSSARWIVRAYLVFAILGTFAAGFEAAWRWGRRVPTIGDQQTPTTGMAQILLRTGAPVFGAWFLMFLTLLIWPMPSVESLSGGSHVLVFVATVICVELSYWCAAAFARYLA